MAIALLSLTFAVASARYCSVTSAATPAALLSFLPSCLSLSEVHTFLSDVDVLVDATFEEVASAWLAALSQELHVPLLVLGPASTHPSRWTYYLGTSLDLLAIAMDDTLRCLGFRSVNLVGDISSHSLRLTAALCNLNSSVAYDRLLLSPDEPLETYVRKVLRPRGRSMTVFTTLPGTTKELLKAQYQMHIGGAGYANLMPTYSSLYVVGSTDLEDNLVTGNLVVAESEEEPVLSEEDWAAQLFSRISPYFNLTSSEATALLQSAFPSHVRTQSYVLLNQQHATKVAVGSTGSCPFDSPILYLGNASTIALNSSSYIQISANFGQTDLAGFQSTDTVTAAAMLALAEISAKPDLLPHFSIQVWNFSVGIFTFQPQSFLLDVLPHSAKLGAAILSNIGSSGTISLITALRQHHISTPVVAASNNQDALSSQQDYPHFIRTCLPDSFLNVVIIQTIKHFGWTKCALLAIDSQAALTARSVFQQLLSSSGIAIVNDPSLVLAAFPGSLEEARANYTATLQQIINTRCRILVGLNWVRWDLVALVLSDLGLRKGDLVILGSNWPPLSVELLTSEELTHAADILSESIQFSPEVFVGSTGHSFAQKFYQVTHLSPNIYGCLYYDAAYTIAYALEWLLQTGKDFYESSDMMAALHGVRFEGCSGLVSFEVSTNDRQSMRYALQTILYNSSVGLYVQKIGTYDPTGIVLLKMDSNFTWWDGTTLIPSNMRESLLGCPFEDRLSQRCEAGFHILLSVCLCFFVFTLAVGAVVWRHYRAAMRLLTEESDLDSDDALVIAGVSIHLLQFLGLGPDFSFVHPSFQFVLRLVTGDLEALLSLHDGYVHLWIVTASIVSGSLLAGLLLRTPLCKFENGVVRTLLDLWLYMFAHWLFIPIVQILMNCFSCTQAVAVSAQTAALDTSYLTVDCYMTCWAPSHIVLVSLSTGLLLLYIGAAVEYQLRWQASSTCLNVHTDPVFLSWTSALHVLLVLLCLCLRKHSPLIHAVLFCALSSCALIYCLVRRPYGYSVLCVRQVIAICSVIWPVCMAICHLVTSEMSQLIVIVLVVVEGLIFLSGEIYILLKVPILLHRRQGRNTFYLFKFAFKPATSYIVGHLQQEFQGTSNRCVVQTGASTHQILS